MSIDELRRRRAELQALDDAVSYVRRVAQGRADLARDAVARSSDDGDPTPVYARRDLHGELRDVLADRLLGSDARPPRPAEDFSAHPLAVELDDLCAANGFSRLDRLTTGELERLVGALDQFERRISAQRRDVFAELDALTEELVARYRAAQPGGDEED
jgi:hypothetical protein